MTIFADLECPACAAFDARLAEVTERFGDEVNVVFVHYPLSYHRFALPAARAAECAARMGVFSQWVRAIYAGQDSLGSKSWTGFAGSAGIGDTLTIHNCATGSQNEERITQGLALGQQLEIMATPTVFLNDWRFWAVPSTRELHEAVELLLAGRPLSR